ncbi:hypothetical protein [Dethiobacter alkaliphilus]|uniref:hypothetical protein n=1 Tax=Dethiobacter alkaliphilus TaxID=427926 RepID=UPI0022262FB6|nr:hypothetical protein [Dethiobacter alkaliphilus]MCW3489449.1 hypothetical protein [Dethiobacter alkaliphilus]
MKYNKPLYAVLIGMAIAFIFEAYTQIAKLLGLTPLSIFETNSSLFMAEPSWIIGLLTTPLTGALVGFVIYQMTRYVGEDYLYLKSALFSMFTWAAVQIMINFAGQSDMVHSVSGNVVMAIGAALVGALAGYLISKFLLSKTDSIK